MRYAVRILFWLLVVYIVWVTLSPIAFRPETDFPPGVERFAAFALVGFLGPMAYPKHRLAWTLALVIGAGLLEASQNLTPDRHGRVIDFLFKALGVLAGGAVARLLERWRLRRAQSNLPSKF